MPEGHVSSLHFKWSPYALLWFFPVISSITLIYFLQRRRSNTSVTLWFSIFNTTILVWSVATILEALSADATTYSYVTQFSALGFLSIG
ncbi:MAG: hypothetical protein JWL85_220, partial [Candidatus Saccharibacteria bacterium]|nr:hypothetical protein [Candidatus Saccharibacteria bacterium]